MSIGPYPWYPWGYPSNTSPPIAQQTEAGYLNYLKTKEFEDVGYFLINYVVSGGDVTKNITSNNVIDVTDIVVSLNNDVMTRDGTTFKTTSPSSTYFLDFKSDGDYSWGTTHPEGTAGVDYLTVAQVTTDASSNVDVISDERNPFGGFRLKPGYPLEGYLHNPALEDEDMNGHQVKNLSEPVDPNDAIRKVEFDELKDETSTFGINVKYPPPPLVGAKGDGVTDDTAALTAIRNYVSSFTGDLPALIFPSGTYLYSVSPNWGIPNLKIVGLGDVILKCTGTGNAFILDASPDGVYRYYENISIKNIIIQGNTVTPTGFYLRNIARSTFEDIEVRDVETTAGIAFSINFATICLFKNLVHTIERSSFVAYEGLQLTNSDIGGQTPTDNTFIYTVMEGMKIGIRLFASDVNTFIGGTAESCSIYGIVCGTNARSNIFIGVDTEDNGTADISDAGIFNTFLNCLSQKEIIIQGTLMKISGGIHQKITIDGAINPVIENIWVNQMSSGGGIVLNGNDSAKITNVIDRQTGDFLYGPYAMSPVRDRVGITVGASPFVHENDTYYPQLVNILGGTISQILWGMAGGDTYPIAGGGSTGQKNGQFLLMPGDHLRIDYTVAPEMNYIPR